MNETHTHTQTPFFADKQEKLAEILSRYPADGRRSALMPLLWEVQREERYVSEERMRELAEIVGTTATEVKGVMSFYSTYHDELFDFLSKGLGTVNGETTADGRFSLQKVECVGSCGTAPVVQVNDTYYERVGRGRCRHLVDALRQGELPPVWRERGGDTVGAAKAEPVKQPTDRGEG